MDDRQDKDGIEGMDELEGRERPEEKEHAESAANSEPLEQPAAGGAREDQGASLDAAPAERASEDPDEAAEPLEPTEAALEPARAEADEAEAERASGEGELDAASRDGDEAGLLLEELEEGPDHGVRILAILEAMLFASPEPLTIDEISAALPELAPEIVERALDRLGAALVAPDRGLRLERIAGGYRLVTRPELAAPLRALFRFRNQKRLTPATLDVLAIVAYAQPITAPEIAEIRGADPAYALRVLLDRKLVRMVGRKRVVGRPILYGTTRDFLLHFGLDSLEDLPPVEGYGTQVVPAQGRLFPVTEAGEGEEIDPVDEEVPDAPAEDRAHDAGAERDEAEPETEEPAGRERVTEAGDPADEADDCPRGAESEPSSGGSGGGPAPGEGGEPLALAGEGLGSAEGSRPQPERASARQQPARGRHHEDGRARRDAAG